MERSSKCRYKVKGVVLNYDMRPYGYMLYDILTNEPLIVSFEECIKNSQSISGLSYINGSFNIVGVDLAEMPVYDIHGRFVTTGMKLYVVEGVIYNNDGSRFGFYARNMLTGIVDTMTEQQCKLCVNFFKNLAYNNDFIITGGNIDKLPKYDLQGNIIKDQSKYSNVRIADMYKEATATQTGYYEVIGRVVDCNGNPCGFVIKGNGAVFSNNMASNSNGGSTFMASDEICYNNIHLFKNLAYNNDFIIPGGNIDKLPKYDLNGNKIKSAKKASNCREMPSSFADFGSTYKSSDEYEP